MKYLQRKHISEAAIKRGHGETSLLGGKKASTEWLAWNNMHQRCYYAGHMGTKKNYIDRGIVVSPEWHRDNPNGFNNFLADMGRKPTPKHSLDRVDNDGNYEWLNCRWATIYQQNNNTTRTTWIPYKGKKYSISQLARKLDVTRISLYYKYIYV